MVFALWLAGMALAPQSPALTVPALSAPTRDAPAPTPAETATLREGIAFFDQRRYDEAMAKFREVADANPHNVVAIYEIALVHHARKELQQAIDVAARGTTYRSSSLAQLYSLIGNTLDQAGEPRRAVEVYEKGLEHAPTGGSLAYNLAITYAQSLKDVAAAKAVLKRGARAEPNHAGNHLLLGRLFLVDDLRAPALLALSRFLMLEPGSSRTAEAYKQWYAILNPNLGPSGTEVRVNPNQKKDEGDLARLDLHIAMSKVTISKTPRPTVIQSIAAQVEMLFGVYAAEQPMRPGDDDTFLWSYYMPFFRELSRQKHVEPFVYYISQRVNLPGIREWGAANTTRVQAFLDWVRGYAWPK
jgi:tetratricopeptide (TPR) repeat protein